MKNIDLLSKKKILKTNILFIFVFLVIWEVVLARGLFNGTIFGLVLFGPVSFLWYLGKIRASMLATLISIFEVTVLAVFLVEGFQFGGAGSTLKAVYWTPYFAMALINTIVGLRIYGKYRREKEQSFPAKKHSKR